jgi:hypothetical protein|tara:strand:+ start:1592 stop:2269 length:678 start_codon:yes stop_codon:yes gene_type:complete
MANRFPLIVDSSSQQIKELPDGDSLLLGDSEKLKIGDDQDLELYHDGSNGYLVNTTGDLYLRDSGGDIYIQGKSGESSINVLNDGAVELFYDNSKKFETVSSGAIVTGFLTATTGARITQVALTSASSVSWDALTQANAFLLLGHNVTFAAPSNALEGAIISVEIAQPDATASGPHTVAWNTVFEFAASTAPTVTATGSKTDIFSFRYNGSVWQEIGRVQNMAQT